MTSFKLKEDAGKYISTEIKNKIKELIGKTIENNKFGTGTIKNVSINDPIDFEDWNWGDLYVEFPELGEKRLAADGVFYNYDEEGKKIINLFADELKKAGNKDKEAEEQKLRDKIIQVAIQHAQDKFTPWYDYFTGKIKTKPTDLPSDFLSRGNIYMQAYEKEKARMRRRNTISNSLANVDETILDTYTGNVKALVEWITKNLHGITVHPRRDEEKENMEDILDYIRERGGDTSIEIEPGKFVEVKIGNSRGDMRDYRLNLKKGALETCPDKEAFLAWKAPKYNMKKDEEIEALVYNPERNNIESRRVVLDYLLNKDKYLKMKDDTIPPYIVVGFDLASKPQDVYGGFATEEDAETYANELNAETEREYGADNPDTYEYAVLPNDGKVVDIVKEVLK